MNLELYHDNLIDLLIIIIYLYYCVSYASLNLLFFIHTIFICQYIINYYLIDSYN